MRTDIHAPVIQGIEGGGGVATQVTGLDRTRIEPREGLKEERCIRPGGSSCPHVETGIPKTDFRRLISAGMFDKAMNTSRNVAAARTVRRCSILPISEIWGQGSALVASRRPEPGRPHQIPSVYGDELSSA